MVATVGESSSSRPRIAVTAGVRALLTISDSAFGLTIRRNCSASPAQLAWALAGAAALAVLIGAGFAAFGLWLVLPFVGLELLALAAAFFCYGRHAADCERIELDAGRLCIEQRDGHRVRQTQLTAPWTRVELDASGRGPLRRVRVLLIAHGVQVEVGRHLPDAQRPALARSLQQALQRAATSRA